MADQPGECVIRGGRVIGHAGQAAEPLDLRIRGDLVVEVGPPGCPAPAEAAVIDARDRLLIPGLVNAHTHSHGGFSRGRGDGWTLELLLSAGHWTRAHRTVEDKYLMALVGAIEMVQKGCTACYDLFYEFPAPTTEGLEAVGRAYRDVGMRAVLAPMMADRTFYQAIPGLREHLPAELQEAVDTLRCPDWRESLAPVRDALARWPFHREEVALALGPTIPLHCTDEFLVGCRDLAREHGLGLHTHLAETKIQALAGPTRYGTSLTGHLARLGLLGPSLTAAHGIWLDDDDIARLTDAGASVVHNPASNLKLGSGLAPVRRMLDRGVNLALGTDGIGSSGNLNMFEQMRLASFLSRIQSANDRRWLPTEEILRMATEGGGQALGSWQRIGRIAPGYKADLVFLDLGHINYVPLGQATNQLVHTEDGVAVDRVMIGGRLVVERGRVRTVDPDVLRPRIEQAVERLATLTVGGSRLAERLEPAVEAFCRRMASQAAPIQRYADTR